MGIPGLQRSVRIFVPDGGGRILAQQYPEPTISERQKPHQIFIPGLVKHPRDEREEE
jgi:hypothetical protein